MAAQDGQRLRKISDAVAASGCILDGDERATIKAWNLVLRLASRSAYSVLS